MKEYIPALKEELRGQRADTVFIGGGTPSVLKPSDIEKILSALYIEQGAEITIEANPESMDREKARAYLDMGINRLSMGFQSLDDGILDMLGRIHDSKMCYRAYDDARNAGFENINVDMMFALPHQTMEILNRTMDGIIDMEPDHISAYSLQLEEGTKLYRMVEQGLIKETEEAEDREMYHHIIERLSHYGYEQYEVSNLAKKGYRCRHNLKYWSMEEYAGCGLGASSFYDGKRIVNTSDFEKYINGDRIEDIYHNTIKDNAGEYVFTGMRKTEGIKFKGFEEYVGTEFDKFFPWFRHKADKWEEQGLILLDKEGFRFTLPGMDVQNSILKEFV